MIKIGKDYNGITLYMTDAEIEVAAQNLESYKTKLTRQQFAKLRKIVNKKNRGV